ncbi:MAG: glutamate--tRNA ligase [Calditrichia bacterium]
MENQIRVRFAPSPTGYLHVGGLRTALYNYLFARHHDGKLVLRIEDTDRTRYVPGAVENLIGTMKNMGLAYDEGPDMDGSFGPYMQSQRLKLYREHTQKLLDSGHAYYCFCTAERLEEMRRRQEAAKLPVKYDGTCRRLSAKEVKEKLESGIPHVVRLKMPETGETVFNDLIRGEVTFQNELVDDQVLMKSDGYPTYHLANVIDDHHMRITHVIRGEEWLPSVPKHIMLYKAFGWEVPNLAHLPLLLNPDRSKLSKRQGDVAVEDFLEKGYLAAALINFIALLGWNPGTEQEIFSLEELIREFSLERVNKAGAVFDLQKLNWMNGHYIRQLTEEERIAFLRPFLEKAGYDVSNPEKNQKIISAFYERISIGSDIIDQASIFYRDSIEITDEEAVRILQAPSARTVLHSFLKKVEAQPEVSVDTFKSIMKEVQQETGIKKQELWMPIRVALTGVDHGPDLPLVIEIFGKNKIQRFVQQVLDRYMS